MAELVQLINEVGKKLELLEYKNVQWKPAAADHIDRKDIEVDNGKYEIYTKYQNKLFALINIAL